MSRPDEKDVVIMLGVKEGMSIREMGEKCGIEPSAVHRRLSTLEGKTGSQFVKIPFVFQPFKKAARSRKLTDAGVEWLQVSGYWQEEDES